MNQLNSAPLLNVGVHYILAMQTIIVNVNGTFKSFIAMVINGNYWIGNCSKFKTVCVTTQTFICVISMDIVVHIFCANKIVRLFFLFEVLYVPLGFSIFYNFVSMFKRMTCWVPFRTDKNAMIFFFCFGDFFFFWIIFI